MADGNHDIGIEDIIAAMLSEKHALSAEDLKAFEVLLNNPDLDAAKRQAFLQTIWNTVVGIIDFTWKMAAMMSTKDSCGQQSKGNAEGKIEPRNMLYSQDNKLLETHRKAAENEKQAQDAI